MARVLVENHVNPQGIPLARNVVSYNGQIYPLIAIRVDGLGPGGDVVSLLLETEEEVDNGFGEVVLELFTTHTKEEGGKSEREIRQLISDHVSNKRRPNPWFVADK